MAIKGAAPAGPTEVLGRFAAELRFENLPKDVVTQACHIILDTVGCAIGAWQEDPAKGRIATDLVKSFGATGAATIWGSGGTRTDAALAAMANGILANAADFDDTHKRALLHTGSVVVPTVLALAEERKLSGKAAIVALVAGYETAVRVGMAVMPTHYRFWHSTATNGTFGAAASAASAMGLDAKQARMALGFAGTQAAGLNTFFTSGDFTKSLHPGKATLNGILSARLAHIGATSPPTMLEHEKGYLAAYSPEPKADALVAGLGSTWEILQNGFKYFPSILASHAPIQATLSLVQEHDIKPADIASIKNETYSTVKSHFSAKAVTTSMGARVSVPYCIAVAALDRKAGQAQFAEARVAEADVQALLRNTDVIADAELTKLYPDKFPARVTITLRDGRKFTALRNFPKGDPQEPLTRAEIESKFRANVEGRLSPAQVGRAIDIIGGLAEQRDLSPLLALIGR
jgi:2-methylcitrate dehydratase PrpD